MIVSQHFWKLWQAYLLHFQVDASSHFGKDVSTTVSTELNYHSNLLSALFDSFFFLGQNLSFHRGVRYLISLARASQSFLTRLHEIMVFHGFDSFKILAQLKLFGLGYLRFENSTKWFFKLWFSFTSYTLSKLLYTYMYF